MNNTESSLKEALTHHIRANQTSKHWVLVVNPTQRHLYFPGNGSEVSTGNGKQNNHVLIGAIVSYDDWMSDADIIHGEGVFVDIERYNIIQTNYVVTVVKSDGRLLKIAKGIGQQYLWEEHVVENLRKTLFLAQQIF